uniref:Uncharacterized protein n=1 Tax=Anopheles arabiensis TaxID=7173 RepID=A0A182IHN5_ANOAR
PYLCFSYARQAVSIATPSCFREASVCSNSSRCERPSEPIVIHSSRFCIRRTRRALTPVSDHLKVCLCEV